MTVQQAVLGFALVAGLLTLVPGLDTALILRTSLTSRRRSALATAAGIQVGCLAWGAAAALGATAVLAASQTAYRVLTLAGAAYLVWMGVRLLVAGFRKIDQDDDAHAGPRPPSGVSARRAFTTGLVTNLLNPKVGVFYLATIPQFSAAGVPPLAMGLLLAGVHCAIGSVWSLALVLGSSALGSRLASTSFARWVDRVTGGVLVLFGVRVALSARTL
ncbi:Threonine/homoserine/homoserine lactone efflux protein [Quadrisphaera granulorum]|uniref:Threonine/homoserine/homoserine lactone efflux protein n=1 Tax=Quadrisphaera granulorum TaxID=317664 RepID=A0A316A6H9_9ACTN|nr:LysE family translocator [Quadrisphaera granulorum]PWJ53481.1 threonine/homoserine/homoserine lactone efflux protein [Quadrisphaera granulorum]SZE96823.1 Threonine/homoserine/homoserine lactone efflux protein [Quadrisphaera granulorum]